ncbi:MAG: hypothetical protein MUD14_23375 [Hydrococcus sp. Prado102]|jgi:hypothetical protein|nr:hypothetical protein [Hydrococcus sp. Prado102]
MSDSLTPRQPLGSLSVGNIVSAAVVLFRSNLKAYLGIAFRAILWSFFPVLAVGIVFGLFFALFGSVFVTPAGTVAIGRFLLLTLISVLIWIFCFPKYLVNAALISRLAFNELINQPESVSQARRYLLPRQWSFFRISIQIFFSLVGIYFGLGLCYGLLIAISGVIGNILNNQFLGGLIVAIVAIVGLLAFIFLLIWFFSRWLISEVPLAVEEDIDGADSIDRSWRLTKNSVVRIQLIVLVAFLVTIPVIAVLGYLPQIIMMSLQPGSILFWIVYFFSFVMSFSGNLFILPFWQAIKAVIYYDLRIRKEGLDLQIRER